MRKKTIPKEEILEASISLVAQIGLENFTAKKVATALDISEGTIFNNFPNKTALLVACLYHIDNQLDEVLKSVSLHITAIPTYVHDMWYAYFDYFVNHGDSAKFYLQFRHSSYYTEEVIKGQNNSFAFFAKFLQTHTRLFKIDPDIFWIFIIETTLNFSIRMADNLVPRTQQEIDSMYLMISNGVKGVYMDKNTLK